MPRRSCARKGSRPARGRRVPAMPEVAVRPTPELDDTIERLPTSFDLCCTWNYETLRQEVKNLYEKAKRGQWNATDQLPWATNVDPEAEIGPDFQIPVYDTHI